VATRSRADGRGPAQSPICESLAGYLTEVERIVREWTPPGVDWYLQPWFRGHGNAQWSLRPGLYRMQTAGGLGAEYYSEARLLESFRLRAPRYLEREPSDDWEWLFVMQHYGLPTRLLDWTESALIALYFAVRDHSGRNVAAVWATNPWWINKEALGGDYDLFPATAPQARPWRVGAAEGERGRAPVAILPVHESARIQSQRGVFTIHGDDKDGLDTLARRRSKDACLRRLLIPARAAPRIFRELSVAGISESLIFPELPGLCREMKRSFFGE
jgi:FRG domain-containing protein